VHVDGRTGRVWWLRRGIIAAEVVAGKPASPTVICCRWVVSRYRPVPGTGQTRARHILLPLISQLARDHE